MALRARDLHVGPQFAPTRHTDDARVRVQVTTGADPALAYGDTANEAAVDTAPDGAPLPNLPEVDPTAPAPTSAAKVATTLFTAANVVSIAGFAAALHYLYGGGGLAYGVAAIAAGEIEGRLASTPFHDDLDAGIDVALTALAAERLRLLWALPAVVGFEAYLHSQTNQPPFLSARTILLLGLVAKRSVQHAAGAPRAAEPG